MKRNWVDQPSIGGERRRDESAAARLNLIATASLHSRAGRVPNTFGLDSGGIKRPPNFITRGGPRILAARPGQLKGVWIFNRPTHRDERGYFHEVFQARDLEEVLGEPVSFLQINHSRSLHNVLRGLHAEDWNKLVYVPRGSVFTALADIRPESPTFGQTEVFHLGEGNNLTVYVPRGIAHGYHVLSEVADYVYQVTAYYDGTDTRAVAWDDPDLAITWLTTAPILSDRDKRNPTLRELVPAAFQAQPLNGRTLMGVGGAR